jgi:GT2 family glycosyltransferase
MTYPTYELVVVDNHSTDRTIEAVQEKYPDVVLLIQPVNKGFAAGANAGLQRAIEKKADFALIINNDVLVMPSMLTALIESLTPDVGAVAPMIYYMDEPERIWSAGFLRDPILLEPRGSARGQVDRGQWLTPFNVDYLLGCALLISVPLLKEVGLFDERYFFYYEDLDLSLRIKQKGYRLINVPQAKMWHKVASSAPQGSSFRTYHLARSSVIFFRTHARGLQRPAVLIFRLGSAVKSSWKFLMGKRFDLLQNYWKGLWDGWQIK